MIALHLVGQTLDPQLQDAINRCSFWRWFLRRFNAMKDDFLEKLNHGLSRDRPVGALRHALQQFAWQPEGSFLFILSLLAWIGSSLFRLLVFALEKSWQRQVCDDLKSTRPGFNISAVDVSGVRASLAYFHGGPYTRDIMSKWVASKSTTCPNCERGTPGSRYPSVFQCHPWRLLRPWHSASGIVVKQPVCRGPLWTMICKSLL